ncbi:MAG: hypothetical protein ACJ757_13000 [Gaiellaceae bacterium]
MRKEIRRPSGVLGPVDLGSPVFVDVGRVVGGFSSVVEVADAYCLRFYAAQVEPIEVVARRWGAGLASALQPLLATLSDPWWQSFAPVPAQPYGVGYALEPARLRIDGDRVTIVFEGVLSVYGPPPPSLPPFRPGSRPFDVGPPLFASRPSAFADEARQPAETDPVAPTAMFLESSHTEAIGGLRDGFVYADFALWEAPLVPLHRVGSVRASLEGRLASQSHPQQRSVDVLLDLRSAKVTVTPGDGDAKLIYDAFLSDREGELETIIAPVPQLRLTPTISVVGRNAGNTSVPELPDFDVRVFAVGNPDTHQAVCAAFDLVPGCAGTIESVGYFIGRSDYGVIHNEFTVERVLHHQWNIGGFDRSVGMTRRVSIKVKRDGNEHNEDADVYGHLQLDSLETVALEPHPDRRADLLVLAGRAEGIADRVVLVRDGTTLTPANADLGPPDPVPWAVNLDASVTPVWASDPELRQFQERATQDGVRHLSRPFARVPEVGGAFTSYVRLEAIAKRFFAVGTLEVF